MNRRGFAYMTAVLLIPLAAAAVGSVSELLRVDVRRTNDAMIEAQLTQIVLAGCLQAKTSSQSPLPPSLLDNGAAIQIDRHDDQATVRATLQGQTRTVTIRLSR